MCHLTRDEVAERNRQYKELMMSKNVPVTYQIDTLDASTRKWVKRMDSVSETYLDSVGRRWVDGKFCLGYRIVKK